MSSTRTTEVKPHTLTLTNGNTFTFESNASSASEQIPTIDISRMHSEQLADRQALAEEIRRAAHDVGFFSIVNHVRPPPLCSDLAR
jgi:hypothetical protein